MGQGPDGLQAMSKKVLIVEDNDLNLKLFHDLLEVHGYAPIVAREGRGVVELVRAEQPDLIIMDIQLPDKSGLEVTRELKADPELKNLPVVAVTAFAMRGDEENIKAAGCDAYIAKPISIKNFLETVKSFIG